MSGFLLFFLLWISWPLQQQPAPVPARPNIVLIFMDDMGYGDPVCFGGGPYRTPAIDALAAGGMRCTNFYAAQAVCSASRSALLTGCYPTRIGIHGALDHRSRIALNPQEETIASVLKARGYHTGMVGKWHLGNRPPYLPLHFGFDEFLGLPYSNDMWPIDYSGRPWTDTANYRSTYPPLPLLEGDRPIDTITTLEEQGMLTRRYTERAVDFIRRQDRQKNSPFFLYLAHSMVHVPLAVSPTFRGKSGAGLFGDVMEEVDWSVGEVVRALRETGQLNNTLLIFTSDNGPWLTFGNHAGNSGGLREGKGTAWEGGQKVPAIFYWPGKVPAGTVSSRLLTTMDILPTLAQLGGASLPKKTIDGVDISAVLLGDPQANPRRELAYYYDRNNLKAIRRDNWKLVFPARSQTYGPPATRGEDGYPGKYGNDSVHLALYDLSRDPGEDRDVQSLFPAVVEELQQLAEKYRAAMGDGLRGITGRELRPAAQVN